MDPGDSDDKDSIANRVGEVTDGKGAYAAVDSVGGDMLGKLLSAVRPRGTLLLYGAMSGVTFNGQIPDLLFHLKVGHRPFQHGLSCLRLAGAVPSPLHPYLVEQSAGSTLPKGRALGA